MNKQALSLLFVVFAVSGCAQVGALDNAANTQNPITMNRVFVLQSTYDAAVLVPAASYRALGICAKGIHATLAEPCAERSIVVKLQKADKRAQAAFAALKLFVTAHPGQLGASGLYDAAALAVSQAQAIVATFKTA